MHRFAPLSCVLVATVMAGLPGTAVPAAGQGIDFGLTAGVSNSEYWVSEHGQGALFGERAGPVFGVSMRRELLPARLGNLIFQFEATYVERGFDWVNPGPGGGWEARQPPVQMTIGAVEFPFLVGWSYQLPRLNLGPVLLIGAAPNFEVYCQGTGRLWPRPWWRRSSEDSLVPADCSRLRQNQSDLSTVRGAGLTWSHDRLTISVEARTSRGRVYEEARPDWSVERSGSWWLTDRSLRIILFSRF